MAITPSLPHPPWYRLYPRATSIPFLTAITLRFAAGIRVAAREARAIAEQQEQRELLRFEELIDESIDEELHSDDDDSIASDASTDAHLDRGSSLVFRTPTLRPNQ